MRLAFLVLLFGPSLTAWAEGDEFGVRYWYSEGRTSRAHSAQEVVPQLGNPTSVLTWSGMTAHAVELHGRKTLDQGAYLKGYAGLGRIKSGSLRDEDFFAGQVKVSDTTSKVKGDSLSYASIDLGGDAWRFANGSAGLFVGYHFWREYVDAYGIVRGVPVGPTTSDSVLVISNEVTWQALRAGFGGAWNASPATQVKLDAALVPYAHVRDADSHWLRQSPNDLGPVPNIHSKGTGYGFQLDAEVRHLVQRDLEIGFGLRYWWLRARNGEHEQGGFNLKLTELESQRFGLTLSLTQRW
jgi:hypothetical protein